MLFLFKKNKSKGFAIIEIMVACAIISITTFAMVSSVQKGLQLSYDSLKNTEANLLLEEGAEVVKIVRDTDWNGISSLSFETPYYFSYDTNLDVWSLVQTQVPDIDGIFSRSVIFSEVSRNAEDDIDVSGVVDEGTIKVKILVSWPSGGVIKSKNLSFYVSDIFN